MVSTGKKLIVAVLMIPSSLVLVRINGWFAIGFLLGMILSILYCIDYAYELREIEQPTKVQRFIRVLLTVPQILFGLVVLTIGVSIALWVLYNSFVERQPQYSGGILTFGMASLFILFGIGLIKISFKKHDDSSSSSN